MANRAAFNFQDSAIYVHDYGASPAALTDTLRKLVAAHGEDVLHVIVGNAHLPGSRAAAWGWSYLDPDTPDLSHLPDDYDMAAWIAEDTSNPDLSSSEARARALMVANRNTAATGRHRIVPGIGALALAEDVTQVYTLGSTAGDIDRIAERFNGEFLQVFEDGTAISQMSAAALARRQVGVRSTDQPVFLVGNQGGRARVRSARQGEAGVVLVRTEFGELSLRAGSRVGLTWG